jgi:predicted nucleotidyltransferase
MLDVNGWDMRKALQLLVRSNAVLLEWLTSPVRYRDDGVAPTQLLVLARSTADLTAIAYHYERQARRDFADITASEAPVRLKTYCYALRAAMCLQWISRFREPPPMDLPSLLAGLRISQGASSAIAGLLAIKAQCTEKDTTPRIPALDRLIGDVLAATLDRAGRIDRSLVAAQADALFAKFVLDDFTENKEYSIRVE